MQTVWGNNYSAKLEIPKMINDYNHWMNGVDKADQLISYYRTKLRCRQTWMPIFMYCLDIIRINSYLVCKHHQRGDNTLEHKDFLEDWVKALNERAVVMDYNRAITRSTECQTFNTPPSTSGNGSKRRRMSHKTPSLPNGRLYGSLEDHAPVIPLGGRQHRCIYCSYKFNKAKKARCAVLPHIRRVKRMCHQCQVYLCTEHFGIYHSQAEDPDLDGDDNSSRGDSD